MIFSPEFIASEPELLSRLQSEGRSYPNLRWDDASNPLEAMEETDILVSDISGIVFDFCFLTEKPVITLGFRPDKRGFEASDLPYEPWELRVLDLVGTKIRETDFDRLLALVASRKAQIRALRDEFVVNFGRAAGQVVDELGRLSFQRAQQRKGVVSELASPVASLTTPTYAGGSE